MKQGEMYGIQEKVSHGAYRKALQDILDWGTDVEVRGMKTREILNYVHVIEQPWQHCHAVPGRRWNPWMALSEALWILAGREDIAPLLKYNKRIASFSDDGKTNYGAYGPRIIGQLDSMIKRLEADPHDRRAILQIWRPADLTAVTKDPPCNDMIMFKLRDRHLHMTVINRSNDLHWGLYGVNLPTFGILQEYIASRLRVSMGTQTHLSNSLHIYTGGQGMKENWRITERMMSRLHEPLVEMPYPLKGLFTEPISTDTLVRACNDVLGCNYEYDKICYEGIPFFEFADDFLRCYRLKKFDNIADECRWAQSYADWIYSAEMWVREGEDRFK